MPNHRRISPRAIVLAALCPLAVPVLAQSAAPSASFSAVGVLQNADTDTLSFEHGTFGVLAMPADRNAALMYLRHFVLLSDETRGAARAYLTGLDDGAVPEAMPEDTAEILSDAADVIDAIERATRLPVCDFGVETELGPHAMMPHLGQMRDLARVLAADAHRLALADQPERAADRLAALHRLAEHLGGDRVAISSLVGMAIHALAAGETTRLLDHGLLTKDARARLITTLDAIDLRDPAGVRAAVAGEGAWVLDSIERLAERRDPERLNRVLSALLGGDGDAAARDLIDARPAAVLRAVEQAREHNRAVLEHWDAPDAQAKLEALDAMVASNAYGPIAKHFGLSAPRIRASTDKIVDQLTTLRARLDDAGRRGETVQP